MSDLKKKENLHKMSLAQLEEILQRENIILRNKKLIEKLPDEGESIKLFRDLVEKEIQYRKNVKELNVNKLSMTESDKHIQKLCEIEKTPGKERYKPFATLNKVMEVQSDSKIFQIMEDCAHCNKPTKLIKLPESIDILMKQEERIKEEQIKARHRRILEKLNEDENVEEGSGSEENYSELEEVND